MRQGLTGGPSLVPACKVTQAEVSPEGNEPVCLFPFLGRHKGMMWPNPRGPDFLCSLLW